MSKNQKKKLAEVEKEDKKPPVIQEPPPVENENQDINSEKEKEFYEGQDHIEENPPEQLEENLEVVTQNEKEPETPKKIITRPRETYLQEKLSKMKCNTNLVSNIKKELNDQIKEMVEDDNVLITEVPRSLDKYIKRQRSTEIHNLKQSNMDFSSKQKYKQLKVLKEEQNILKNNLKKIEQNEKLLLDEGFMDLNSNGNQPETMFDKSIKENQLKNVQIKKNNVIDKIKNIELKILNIIEEEQPMTMKEKRKLFIDNFERDKEIAENRAKKYLKESKERSQRMQNDINFLVEKRKKEIEDKDKKDKLLKEENLKMLREKNRAVEQRHSKLNGEILERYKSFANKNLDKKGKDYVYSKVYEKFIKNEEKKFKDLNEERRHKIFERNKIEDIGEFTKKVDEKKEKDEQVREHKKVELTENWKKNKEVLPKCNYEAIEVEEKKKSEEEIKIKEEKQARNLGKLNYAEQLRKNIPEPNANLKKQREKNILSMEFPKNFQVKYTMKNQKKNRIILKKRDATKPSKYKWELKLEDDTVDKFEEVNKKLIKKPKKVNLSPVLRTKSSIPDKKIDYLREMINKREEKIRAMSSTNENIENIDEEINVNVKSKKWEKEVNDKSGTLIENINNVKQKASVLEKEAQMKEKLLKLNGGIENNPELGKKVSSLLIDSIGAKLSILKKMNNVE